jgi:hypothetical protein
MATFHSQTVDIYEDFEDSTLATGLTESDADGILTVNATNRYRAGSHSMSIDCSSGSHNAFLTTVDSQNLSKATVAFWYYTAGWAGNGKELLCCRFMGGGAAHKLITLFDEQTWGGVRNIAFTEMGTGITISSSTWYWFVVHWEAGVGGTLRIYDTSNTQVGSDLTTTGSGGDYHSDHVDLMDIGLRDEFANFSEYLNYDELVLDTTNGAFPILAWDVGGGVSIPVIMYHLQQQRVA